MVRLEDDLVTQIEEYGQRVFDAYKQGQVKLPECEERPSLSTIIRRLMDFYTRYRERVRRARKRKRDARKDIRLPE